MRILAIGLAFFLSFSFTVWAVDFDGDGTDDIGIFRHLDGLWAVRDITRTYFGAAGDSPVPGDYNGDGSTQIAIFRPYYGLWQIQEPYPAPPTSIYFGSAGDIPLTGTGLSYNPEHFFVDGRDGNVGIGGVGDPWSPLAVGGNVGHPDHPYKCIIAARHELTGTQSPLNETAVIAGHLNGAQRDGGTNDGFHNAIRGDIIIAPFADADFVNTNGGTTFFPFDSYFGIQAGADVYVDRVANLVAGYLSDSTSATVDRWCGVHILNPRDSGGTNSPPKGILNNAYAIKIEPIDEAVYDNYAIYAAGGDNYFGGDVGIGTEDSLEEAQLTIEEDDYAILALGGSGNQYEYCAIKLYQPTSQSSNLSYWSIGHRKDQGSGESEPSHTFAISYFEQDGYLFYQLFNILPNGNVGIGKKEPNSKLAVSGLPEYSNQTAAETAGLTEGDFYHSNGTVKVVY